VAANLSDADYLSDPALRDEATSSAASQVSQHPAVRSALLSIQRDFAKNPPGDVNGAILDGRDIGTVICPNADLKFYVTADLRERCRRRHAELKEKMDNPPDFDRVYAEMAARDKRDRERDTAPLTPADDAVIMDTTKMTIDQAVEEAIATVKGELNLSAA
jgi:cytidylate kinase